MKNSKKQLREKTQDLHLRVTKREKDKLSKEASELGVSVSAYIRPLIFGKKTDGKPSSKVIQATALCQDIVTYVQEKYVSEDDSELSERIEKLWEIL